MSKVAIVNPSEWVREIIKNTREEIATLKTFSYAEIKSVRVKPNGGFSAQVLFPGETGLSGYLDCLGTYIPKVGHWVLLAHPRGGSPVIIDQAPAQENDLRARDLSSGMRVISLGANDSSNHKWWKIAKISNSLFTEKEQTSFMGQCFIQGNYASTANAGAVYTFSFGSRGSEIKPMLFGMGDAAANTGNQPYFEIWKGTDGHFYLFFRQPINSGEAVFMYCPTLAQEYWIPESPLSYLRREWDSGFGSKVQNLYLGADKLVISKKTEWKSPAFQSGWRHYGGSFNPVRYGINAIGQVVIEGLASGGTVGGTVFTLDAGFRPQYYRMFPGNNSNGGVGRIDIQPDGKVNLNSYGGPSSDWISFDGIFFEPA
ncbi:hypothetical protein ACTFSJ_27745 [Bacillus cereus group sp. MYBK12-2]|uniref:hypothetical protein n=1 Tax=Bacillus cereus group sp. MYBK12-2 TaxID=3450689 RepID=UPI0032F60169|nr:hypothetical protein [Bacillus pacificus]HDR7653587.1 hypothetical protein [Bacillus pacificus]